MTVIIDGKEFALKDTNIARRSNNAQGFILQPVKGVFIDDETLFTTETKEVLVYGAPVRLFSESHGWIEPQRYMNALRKMVEGEILREAFEKAKRELPKVSNTLQSVLEIKPCLGKKVLAMSNGGYGDCKPIESFVCIELKKNALSLNIVKGEELATRRTQEAVAFVYAKTVQKKKGLSPEAKREYDDAVKEYSEGINIDNLEEIVLFLEELYQDLKA